MRKVVNDDMASANKKQSVCRMSGPGLGYLTILFVDTGRFPNCLVDGANKIAKFKNLKHQRRKTPQREFFFLMNFSIPFLKKDWVLAATPKSHKTIHHFGLCFGLFFLSTLCVGLSQHFKSILCNLDSITSRHLVATNTSLHKFHAQFECHG